MKIPSDLEKFSAPAPGRISTPDNLCGVATEKKGRFFSTPGVSGRLQDYDPPKSPNHGAAKGTVWG